MDHATDTKTAVFDPAAAGWEPYSDDGFIGLIGPLWQRPAGDSYRYAFLAEPKHHNRRGIVQGGMLMTFADRSMGMTCWYANERQPQATVQLDMHFIDAVRIGEFVEARCQVVRRTRALVFMSGELVVGDARRRHRQRCLEDARKGLTPGGLMRKFLRALDHVAARAEDHLDDVVDVLARDQIDVELQAVGLLQQRGIRQCPRETRRAAWRPAPAEGRPARCRDGPLSDLRTSARAGRDRPGWTRAGPWSARGQSGCGSSENWTSNFICLLAIQSILVALIEFQPQPQRPSTSPRSIARFISVPPG